MKKIFLIIGMAAVMSNANCGFKCNESLDRIATALERIARALENSYESVGKKEAFETLKKTYESRVNGRSLKAVPSNDVFIEDEDEISTEDCVEKCWNKLLNNQIKTCIDKCIKENTK